MEKKGKKINKTRVSIIAGALIIALSIIFYSYQRTLQINAQLKLEEEKTKQEELKKDKEKESIPVVFNTEEAKENENSNSDTENNMLVENTENIGSADSSDIKEMTENITPVAPSGTTDNTNNTVNNERKKTEYEKELVSKMSKMEKEFQPVFDNGSMAEVKEAAGKLHTAWDNELNKIYKILMADLPENAKTTLRNSQREWIKNRDRESEIAGKEAEGGSLEGLLYISKATELTEERTKQLAKLYDKLNDR